MTYLKISTTISLFLISVFTINLSAQFYISAGTKLSNVYASDEFISTYSTPDYAIGAKYQINKINISFDYSMPERLSSVDNETIKTKNNKFTLMLNSLPILSEQKFSTGLGIGYYLRLPYEIESSDTEFDKFYNGGLASQLSMNYFFKNAYVSFGLKVDTDLHNSLNNENLNLKNFGFFMGISANPFKAFKKEE